MDSSGRVRGAFLNSWGNLFLLSPHLSWFGPFLFFFLFLVTPACGGGGPQIVDDEWKPSSPIDFRYELGGKQQKLSRLRGRPLVLVFMRTSEIPSQAYMGEVKKAFTEAAGVVRFLVLTIEQREAPFVQPYAESEQLPFPIGIAEPDVGAGLSPLGIIPTMPTTYLIDSQGRICDAAAGVVKSDQLIEAIQQVDKP